MSNFFEKYSQIVGQDKVDKIIQEGKIIGQIKSRRMEIGLTQNDLAELIEVPKSTIGRIEAGINKPTNGYSYENISSFEYPVDNRWKSAAVR
mgnify:CR=1 FL=1